MADAMLPGESSLQYYLRQGMDPNSASQALSQGMTGNGSPASAVQANAQRAVSNYDTRNKQINSGVVQNDWFGHNTNDKNSPYYTGPADTGPRTVGSPLDAAFYGGSGADAVSSASRGNISIPGVPNSSPNISGGWGNVQNNGSTPNPVAPYTGQFYSANRGDNLGAYNDAYSKLGGVPGAPGTPGPATPGTTRAPGPVTTNGAAPTTQTGGIPDINPGEDSVAYMKRIGMHDNTIQYALALSKANPGASFQQIIEYLRQKATTNPTVPTQGPAAAANRAEQERRAAWDAYYAKNPGVQRGGLSQTGSARFGETPVLTVPQG